ncbi:hypothetical protein BC827DRAFT_1183842 [Russula dissimulans]|nr:hypothetical protein BC827DRAFT_1183842 [Russula dissimulans]
MNFPHEFYHRDQTSRSPSSRREARLLDVVLGDSSPNHRSRTCEETGCSYWQRVDPYLPDLKAR